MGGLKDHWKILRKQGLECDLSLKEIFKIWLLFETKLQGMCGEKATVIVWGRGGGQRVERELPCEWISPSLPGISPQPSALSHSAAQFSPSRCLCLGSHHPSLLPGFLLQPPGGPHIADAEALWALALSPAAPRPTTSGPATPTSVLQPQSPSSGNSRFLQHAFLFPNYLSILHCSGAS